MGSSVGSRTTSLGSPRIVVVQGAITARRSLGIATSRESTTTGRREISGSSHHHTSPRAGSSLTTTRRPSGTTPGHPTRLGDQGDGRRMPRMPHLSQPLCDSPTAPSMLHQAASHRSRRIGGLSLLRGAFRRLWYSLVFLACHNHATITPRSQWCSPTHSLSCRSHTMSGRNLPAVVPISDGRRSVRSCYRSVDRGDLST